MLLEDLVNDTDAIWSMTRMNVSDCNIESAVNDTNAFWSMTQIPRRAQLRLLKDLVNDRDAIWSMTRMHVSECNITLSAFVSLTIGQ